MDMSPVLLVALNIDFLPALFFFWSACCLATWYSPYYDLKVPGTVKLDMFLELDL